MLIQPSDICDSENNIQVRYMTTDKGKQLIHLTKLRQQQPNSQLQKTWDFHFNAILINQCKKQKNKKKL